MTARPRSLRLETLYPVLPKTEDGYYRCRYCGKVIPVKDGHYRAWCPGGQCAHEAMIRADPGMAAHALHGREHGICRQCGLDTDALDAALCELRWKATGARPPCEPEPPASQINLYRSLMECILVGMQERGFDTSPKFLEWRKLWACDHILEHAEGGSLEPSNLQTLCTPCHKAKTRRYVSKGQMDLSMLEPFLFDESSIADRKCLGGAELYGQS